MEKLTLEVGRGVPGRDIPRATGADHFELEMVDRGVLNPSEILSWKRPDDRPMGVLPE
jgi:hypothetical protein